jgi:hypothetical protein
MSRSRARSTWHGWAPRRLRGLGARHARTGVIVALAAAAVACTTTVVPPEGVEDPTTVVLIDHGHTPGLALPGANDAAVYVYGDWNYYALRNTGLWDGIRALAWPTQGAVGRRIHPAPLEAPETMESLRRGAQRIHELRVSRRQAEALRQRLDRFFDEQPQARIRTDSLDLEFVPHPRRYTYFGNSNHMVRDWLVELGADARGPAFLSRWRVVGREPAR